MSTCLRVLMVGDVVGSPGRAVLQKHIGHLRTKFKLDFIIVNGENSVQGRGITSRAARFFRHIGVDTVTTGNHVWAKREIYAYLAQEKFVLRPANYPSSTPGVGVSLVETKVGAVGVVNIQGRVFMREFVDCPFRTIDSILSYLQSRTKLIFVDFHAEATAEKVGFAYYIDGKVSAVVGTHTHVQTADERILPGGTAYITDLGMCGALNSMIGMQKEGVLHQMINQMPSKFEVDTNPPFVLSGAVIEVNTSTGRAQSIERVYIVENELVMDTSIDEQKEH